MGILERLGLKRQRGEPKNKYEGNDFSLLFGRTTSGKTVNERTALQTTAVYACVRILSETIASLPIDTPKEEKQRIRNMSFTRFCMMSRILT